MLIIGGFVIICFAVLPSWSAVIAWIGFGVTVMLYGLNQGLKLGVRFLSIPESIMKLSPFTYMAAAPAEDIRITPMIILVEGTALLIGLGLSFFKQRNLDLQWRQTYESAPTITIISRK